MDHPISGGTEIPSKLVRSITGRAEGRQYFVGDGITVNIKTIAVVGVLY